MLSEEVHHSWSVLVTVELGLRWSRRSGRVKRLGSWTLGVVVGCVADLDHCSVRQRHSKKLRPWSPW